MQQMFVKKQKLFWIICKVKGVKKMEIEMKARVHSDQVNKLIGFFNKEAEKEAAEKPADETPESVTKVLIMDYLLYLSRS